MGRVGTKKKKKKKKIMNNRGFYKFPRNNVALYFTYFESIIALAEHVVSLKYPRSGVMSGYFC